MSAIRSIPIIILVICSVGVLRGQVAQHDLNTVRTEFDHPEAVNWVQSFEGTWQGLHPIRMILGYDERVYLGKVIFGDLSFDVSGHEKDGNIVLQEIDDNYETSGYYIIRIDNGKMTGQWRSIDLTRSAILSLRNNTVIELRSFQPEVLQLEGTLSGAPVSFMIQREERNLLSGFCTWGTDGRLYRLDGGCEDATCDKMSLTLSTPDSTVYTLRCIRHIGNTYRLSISGQGKHQSTGQATMTKRSQLLLTRHYQYCGSVDCIYPQIGQPVFDNWIKAQMDAWDNKATQFLNNLHLERETPGPRERWSIRSSAWVDLTMVTADEVSGIITMYNGADRLYKRMAFIFDIKAGRPVQVGELGRKYGFEEQLCADAQSIAECDISQWPSFNYIAINQNGFVVFTDFDHANGDAWVQLPYKRYEDLMKRNALMQKFLKPR
jgi:hypothetical protein